MTFNITLYGVPAEVLPWRFSGPSVSGPAGHYSGIEEALDWLPTQRFGRVPQGPKLASNEGRPQSGRYNDSCKPAPRLRLKRGASLW